MSDNPTKNHRELIDEAHRRAERATYFDGPDREWQEIVRALLMEIDHQEKDSRGVYDRGSA